MKRLTLLIAVLLIFAAGSGQTQQPAAVNVEQGLLQGTSENGLTVYRGIPFAAPPVGDLRWRAPQPAAKWEGIRLADKYAPGPVQGGNPPSGKSEDCLYLNIWTPAKSVRERIPVLVWIYGGGFNGGSTSEKVYSGEKLGGKGVVFVSIAYRVGQLGFLVHPELSAENPNHVSGNYGLLDMIAGLQWIQKNIAAFGGDPDKVTIFGESAGGIAVSMLCASPLAKGLFHGAISQSGGSFGPPRLTTYPGENLKRLHDAENAGEAYVKSGGFTSIAELRKIDADKLPAIRGLAWPIIDGWVIPDDQYKLYENGKYNDTPILVGYNSDEGASFSPPKTPEAYISAVQIRYGKFAEELIKAYPPGSGKVLKTARDLTRDAAFGWHTWVWARLQARTGKSKVFYYYFDQHPDYPEESPRFGYGSPHGQDIAYVFGHLDPSNPQLTKSDQVISEAMVTYWTNFAKYGDPNGEGVPKWEEFTDSSPVVLYFSQTPHMGPVPDAGSLKVLDAYFAWRRTPEGEAWARAQPDIKSDRGTKTATSSIGGAHNPVIFADVPDMSMIRVGDTYYMSSTTMHMCPGVPIMKSKDLVNWQIVNYAYNTLGDIDELTLNNGKNAYGRGSWASCIRYHNDTFYVSTFSATTGKTYIWSTKDIENGPWKEISFRPSFHDHTLVFDDDGRVYLIFGNKKLTLVELNADLSGVREGGVNQVIIENSSAPSGPDSGLGEGSQLFRFNGKYYLFNITWPKGGMRTVVVHRADRITGPWEGKLIFQDLGVAQGGMIDTPDGKWYAYLFRDYGSVGRIPYIVPMKWEDGWPVIGINGKVPETLDLPPSKGLIPGIVASDEFNRKKGEAALPLVWQWNHNPDNTLWSVNERKGFLRLTTGRTDTLFVQARNTLTQRTIGPECSGSASIDVSNMKEGDFAGLALLQRKFGIVGVKFSNGARSVVMVNAQSGKPVEVESIPLTQKTAFLKAECDFTDRRDVAYFYYSLDGKVWKPIGNQLKMEYSMPHFMGYRFGLFNYATGTPGGYADFDWFHIANERTETN